MNSIYEYDERDLGSGRAEIRIVLPCDERFDSNTLRGDLARHAVMAFALDTVIGLMGKAGPADVVERLGELRDSVDVAIELASAAARASAATS